MEIGDARAVEPLVETLKVAAGTWHRMQEDLDRQFRVRGALAIPGGGFPEERELRAVGQALAGFGDAAVEPLSRIGQDGNPPWVRDCAKVVLIANREAAHK